MARIKAELGLRKSREDGRNLPVSTQRANSSARRPKPKPPELAPNPLAELPAAGAAGMVSEKGEDRGGSY